MLRLLLLAVAVAAAAPAAHAQDRAYDQGLVGDLMSRRGRMPDGPVRYARYTLADPSGNSVLARHALYEMVGEGDQRRGLERLAIAQLLGGPPPGDLRLGDTVVLPAIPRDFDLDPVAYAPFPLRWPGADAVDKVVVVDKTVQAWAAYASGRLVRWGPASTGAAASPTPTGRFTMTWREMERESTEAPEGETWLMRYVMNIHPARGIHLHQYDVVPMGPPVGHGCVRLVTGDAAWLWEWARPWQTAAGPGALGARVTAPGTTVIVQGTEPPGPPVRFVDGRFGPERVRVALPPDPLAVPRAAGL